MSSFFEAGQLDLPIAKPKFLPNIEPSNGNAGNDNSTSDTPIFSKIKMKLRIPEKYTGDILHMSVSKNWLVCVLAEPSQTMLIRIFLLQAIAPTEIPIEKYLAGYKISKLFFDSTGHHLLISLFPKSPGLSADFLYLQGNGPKVRRIEKFKDHEITAVAFNNYVGTETSTGPILFGTSRGLIFETELTRVNDTDKPSYRKQVYDLGLGRSKYPITGLELLRMPSSNKYIVVATTPDCLYTFHETIKPEEKYLQAIFSTYISGTRIHGVEEVKTELNYSVLQCLGPPNDNYPKQWGWLCGAGIRIGEFNVDVNCDGDDILVGADVICLNFDQLKHLSYEERRQSLPKTFILTEYHAVLLYSDHITGICLINQEVVYEEYFHAHMGKLINIMRDSSTGGIYLHTEKDIFKYKITDEKRNVWRIYLSREFYEMAEVYAMDNPKHLDFVLERKAEAAFEKADYALAADIYADTCAQFESICLKFVRLEDKRPLIAYIKKRLSKLPSEDTQRVQVLVTWLLDLYLTYINMPGMSTEECNQWQRELDDFMQDPRVMNFSKGNRALIQGLISQHADAHNLSQFSIMNGDFEEVVNQKLNDENYVEALQILHKQSNLKLYYKYGPILIEHLPQDTFAVLMSQARKLQTEKLIPTLIAVDRSKHMAELIKYLEYAVYQLGETHQAIHNLLLHLYVQHAPTKVISYLENEGHDITLIHYDINYALSISTHYNAQMACVHLQCMLQMWSVAVDLALSFNIRLAKDTASKPQDEETRRKLWLRIAHHEIQDTNDVKKALELLKECDLLRIEDLLPFFSDFEKIDDFKEHICRALKEYNQKIQELQHDMEECTKQAERVRGDLQNVRERVLRVEAHQVCNICESFLLVKPFFVFICGHKFHTDCLEKQIQPLLSSETNRKLTMLKQQLDSLLTQSIALADSSNKLQKKRDKLKQTIEEILASDCLSCGLMIDTVDQPFVDDWDQVNIDWE